MAYSHKPEVVLCSPCWLWTLPHLTFHCIIYNHLFIHFWTDICNYLLVHFCIPLLLFGFSLHCSWVLFIEFAIHHLQVSVCFDPVRPGGFSSQFLFPSLFLPWLLLVLLLAATYLDSQPTFRKHVHPWKFEDDSLSSPELCLARAAQHKGTTLKFPIFLTSISNRSSHRSGNCDQLPSLVKQWPLTTLRTIHKKDTTFQPRTGLQLVQGKKEHESCAHKLAACFLPSLHYIPSLC
jgi:hypothetical protein